MTVEEQKEANLRDRLSREKKQNDMATRADQKEYEKWIAMGQPMIPRGPLTPVRSEAFHRNKTTGHVRFSDEQRVQLNEQILADWNGEKVE